MTIKDREVAAISMAVRAALRKMGEQNIRNSEFFGMKQSKVVKMPDAAPCDDI